MLSAIVILISFVFCAVFTALIIPKIILISFKKKLFDTVDERKVHTGIVPRLGGVAFTPAIIISMAFALGLVTLNSNVSTIGLDYLAGSRLAICLSALLVLYLEGVTDDLVGVGYKTKFLVQFLSAAAIVGSGIYFNDLYGLFGVHELTPWIGMPLTVVGIVYIINAINLIDGIDGLASGLSAIALFFFGCMYYHLSEYILSAIAFTTLGTLIPFFIFNVYGNADKGHKIFMGDCGSQTIGLILGLLAVRFSMSGTSLHDANNEFPNALVMAFSVIMIPLLDVMRVFLGRIRRGRNPFMPDKTHIHHKFLALGMSHRTAMSIILMLAAFFGIFNLLVIGVLNVNVLLLLDVVLWIVMIYWINFLLRKRQII